MGPRRRRTVRRRVAELFREGVQRAKRGELPDWATSYFAGYAPEMLEARLGAGDPDALAEYADWMSSVPRSTRP